jgi:hypothetical protein
MKFWKSKVLAGIGAMLLASAASASIYQIQVSGLNLVYTQSNGNVCDTNCLIVTGFNNPANVADPLVTMSFLKDGFAELVLISNISADVFTDIANGVNPAVNATHAATGGVFDFLIGGLPGIATNISSGSIDFSNGSLNMGGTGFSNVFSQNLPNNPAALGADWVGFNPINWSFSSGTGSCTGAAGQQVCTYAGTGELAWSTVPEPGTMLLLGLGLIGVGAVSRKRAAA